MTVEQEWKFMLGCIRRGCSPNPNKLTGERKTLAEEIDAQHVRYVEICERIEKAAAAAKADEVTDE